MEDKFRILLVAFLILTAVFISYLSVLHCGFVNWDDDDYVLINPLVKSLSLENTVKIFHTPVLKIYSPLVILYFAVVHHFFGFDPFIFHLNNLLLHLAVVGLIFRFCLSLGLDITAAGLASLLFGLHPMHVESVAWITECKDVLYSFFYMAALNFYLQYLNEKRKVYFIFAVFCGLLSMLSKPMALSLPFIFYLCDWFKSRKFDFVCISEKFILFLFIVPAAFFTFKNFKFYQFHDGFYDETLKAVWIFIFYIKKFFFPSSLGMFYDLPYGVSVFSPAYFFHIVMFIILMASLFVLRKSKIFVFANAFYILSIFFVIRIVMEHSPQWPPFYSIEDRRMYLPSLGYCLFVGFILSKASGFFQGQGAFQKKLFILTTATVFGFLSLATFLQCQKWKNSYTLWSSVIEQNPRSAIAYNNRGTAQKNIFAALRDYNKCIELDSHFIEAYYNRAVIYTKLKKYDQALADYTNCLKLCPHDAECQRKKLEISCLTTLRAP